jgi:hypothetical protein
MRRRDGSGDRPEIKTFALGVSGRTEPSVDNAMATKMIAKGYK